MVSQRSHDQPYDPVQELQLEQSDTGSVESSTQCFNSTDTFDGHLWTGLTLSFTICWRVVDYRGGNSVVLSCSDAEMDTKLSCYSYGWVILPELTTSGHLLVAGWGTGKLCWTHFLDQAFHCRARKTIDFCPCCC